ncbi:MULTISPECIES: LysR family transcriptional regulator [Roseovarius]|uniref:LysR family transcriptional regulator n=1 Tax=Roseovarius TaxID=74030 RepID=UPI001C97AB9E|nr:LysR family transcriptional regulator [Roseovarius atlanticus]MBY6126552.1 LysR family transcriptional regulator [Roseovarius atlanticus]MBY6151046.1 LysR family transcriptional regulator [Roseovarius atlanticus]
MKAFQTVASAGSFSQAAMSLSVSQPMVTRHIRLLEEELGVELFHRTGRGVVLTEAGVMLKEFVDEIIDREEVARNVVSAMQKSPKGKLVLGVPPSVGTVLTVPLVKKIKNEFPNVTLRVIEGFSGHILEWLTVGRIDAAVLYNPPRLPSVVTEPLVEDELCLIGPMVARDAPDTQVVSLEVMSSLPMILPSRPHGLRRLIDDEMTKAGCELRVDMELEAMSSNLMLVEESSGYTVLPYATVHNLVQQRRVRAWRFDPSLSRQLLLATSTSKPMSPLIRSMMRTFRQEVRDIISSYPWRP